MIALRLGFMRAWVGVWAASALLVFAQGYFMSRQPWMLGAGVALSVLCLWGGWRWSSGVTRRRTFACNTLRVVATLHLLPLLAQLLHLGAPRWDNLLLALVGWGLLEAAGWPDRALQLADGSSPASKLAP